MKPEFWRQLTYLMLSNNCLIKQPLIILLSFWLFLIYQTTVQPIQVIIISLIYYYSSIFLWGFSYHIWVVYCWHVCLIWLYQLSLIPKFVLWCVIKLSLGCIQTGCTDLFHPQFCGRSWQGCRFGVQTCLIVLISFIDTKSPLSSSFKRYFVDYLLVCIIFIGSAFIATETFPWVC